MARLFVVVLGLALCSTAVAARLPGVKTPTQKISCFYVPIKPTTRGTLLCNIKRADYVRSLERKCGAAPIGLDWGGFSLGQSTKAEVVCTGGVLYEVGRDTPSFVTLAYGRSWHYRSFTCTSRFTGLTCTNRAGHGLFLSRASYRLW